VVKLVAIAVLDLISCIKFVNGYVCHPQNLQCSFVIRLYRKMKIVV